MATDKKTEPAPDKKMTEEDIEALPLPEKLRYRYEHGQGSIQDIARVYRVTVDEVLQAIGEGEMASVSLPGDMISQEEAGPGAQLNYGKDYKVPFSLD